MLSKINQYTSMWRCEDPCLPITTSAEGWKWLIWGKQQVGVQTPKIILYIQLEHNVRQSRFTQRINFEIIIFKIFHNTFFLLNGSSWIYLKYVYIYIFNIYCISTFPWIYWTNIHICMLLYVIFVYCYIYKYISM